MFSRALVSLNMIWPFSIPQFNACFITSQRLDFRDKETLSVAYLTYLRRISVALSANPLFERSKKSAPKQTVSCVFAVITVTFNELSFISVQIPINSKPNNCVTQNRDNILIRNSV